MPTKPTCRFCSNEGEQCQEFDMGSGYCFWHDEKFDKSGLELAEKLERFAKKGGLLKGLKLKRANLEGLNLVKHGAGGYDLSGSDFYRANLHGAHLFNTIIRDGSLMKADLRDANLHCCKLENTNLLGIKLMGARIDNICVGPRIRQEQEARSADIAHDKVRAMDYYEQSEEIYRDLRKAAEYQGLFELAGSFTHKELIMRRHQYPKWSRKRIFSKCIDVLCGYGERPLNVIFFSLMLILICAFGYFMCGVSYNDEVLQFDMQNGWQENSRAFFNSLYFSVVTFTTLGYGDITPISYSRLIAAIEAFSGSFSLALFVVVFVKKMTR